MDESQDRQEPEDIPFQDGIVSGRTMTSAHGLVYFLGHSAYYSFDGQTVPASVSQSRAEELKSPARSAELEPQKENVP